MSDHLAELDALQASHMAAIEDWIVAIRREEDLASVPHDVAELDKWEGAAFDEDDLRSKVRAAKKLYEDALREKFLGFWRLRSRIDPTWPGWSPGVDPQAMYTPVFFRGHGEHRRAALPRLRRRQSQMGAFHEEPWFSWPHRATNAVTPALVAGIHAAPQSDRCRNWLNRRAFRQAPALPVGVDGRDKHGHDARGVECGLCLEAFRSPRHATAKGASSMA